MIVIRSAAEWGAPQVLAQAGHPMPLGPKELVVLHHSWRPHRPCGATLAAERADLRGIDSYHAEQGWHGIGYHACGFQSGSLYRCRPTTRTGAHTHGQNSKSLGYCMVIDGDQYAPTDAALEAFREWLRACVVDGLLATNYTIRPHSAFADKTCPGARVTPLIPALLPQDGKPVLQVGDRGEIVRELQRRLIAGGYLREGLATGFFGARTLDAVRAFQAEKGLRVDGVVGPRSWAALG